MKMQMMNGGRDEEGGGKLTSSNLKDFNQDSKRNNQDNNDNHYRGPSPRDVIQMERGGSN